MLTMLASLRKQSQRKHNFPHMYPRTISPKNLKTSAVNVHVASEQSKYQALLGLTVSLIVVIKLLNSLQCYGTDEKNFPVCRMFAWLWPIDSSLDTRQRTAKNTVKSILLRFVQQTRVSKFDPILTT